MFANVARWRHNLR